MPHTAPCCGSRTAEAEAAPCVRPWPSVAQHGRPAALRCAGAPSSCSVACTCLPSQPGQLVAYLTSYPAGGVPN